MRLENDEIFNTLFNEEFEKIPSLFRFNRKRLKISVIVLIVLIIALFILNMIFFSTGKSEVYSSIGLYETMPITTYDMRFLVAELIVAILIALIALWIVLAKLYEKRAFAKASKLAGMIEMSQRHKEAVAWSEWKMKNRDI